MKVSDFTNNSAGAPPVEDSGQLFGIEVEYENLGHSPPGSWQRKYGWTITSDGSLRNGGGEFVSRPMPIRDVMRSFRALSAMAVAHRYHSTARTGIHVHVDMRDCTLPQVAGVLAAYSAFEPLLFDIAGPNRDQCIYCVPWYLAPDQAVAAQMFAQDRHRLGFSLVKYSALYVQPLWSFGTLEFRHATTWLSPEPMRRWVCAINRLVQWGKTQTPESVMAACQSDVNALVGSIFGWTLRHITDPESVMDAVDSMATVDETLPCTYKVTDWDAGLVTNATLDQEPTMYHQQVPMEGDEVPPMALSFDDMATPGYYSGPEDEDEDSYQFSGDYD